MRRSRSYEQGFTLLELLVVMSITTILTAISIQNYSEYQKRAYDANADHMLHAIDVALEAGQTNADDLGTDFFWAWTDNTGQVQGWRVSEFLPGIKLNRDGRINVNYDGWCAEAMSQGWCLPGEMCCMLTWSQAYHCKGRLVKSVSRWNNGETLETEWQNWGC